MKGKVLISSSILLACSAAFAADYFISLQGGLWSEKTTWQNGELPKAKVSLRMSDKSGNLEIDGERKIENWSVWGKHHNIHILDGASLTMGSTGFNQQSVTTCVSGSGFFKSANNTLIGYGGDKGIVYFVSNVELNKIAFDNNRKLLKDLTISMRQPIDRVFKTTLAKDNLYSDLSISGLPNAKTTVELMGNTTVGDIDISNNANVVINTARLFMSGKFKKIEVANSRLELVANGVPYAIGAKVRLNGGASLVLTGNNPYDNFVNILFHNGKSNSIVINGKSHFKGFCIYNSGKSPERVLKIILPKKSSGTVLTLDNIVWNPNSKACLASGSLSKDGAGNSVSGLFIEIENFRNGAISIAKGLVDVADYAKIRANGWKNFRIEKGHLVADKK